MLFRRQGSKRWQARIRRNVGTWVVFSTGQTDIEAAKSAAENKYRDIKYAQKMGRVDVTRRFRSVCQQCRNELYEETERTKRELPKDLAQVIDGIVKLWSAKNNSPFVFAGGLLSSDCRHNFGNFIPLAESLRPQFSVSPS